MNRRNILLTISSAAIFILIVLAYFYFLESKKNLQFQIANMHEQFAVELISENAKIDSIEEVLTNLKSGSSKSEDKSANSEIIPGENKIKPYIRIVSPGGGERLLLGMKHWLSWQALGVDKVYVYLRLSNGELCYLDSVDVEVSNKYSLDLSRNIQCSNISRIIGAGTYSLYLKTNEEGVEISGGWFKIVRTIKPSITVLYPNGGERFSASSQIAIKWRTDDILPSDLLNISFAVYHERNATQVAAGSPSFTTSTIVKKIRADTGIFNTLPVRDYSLISNFVENKIPLTKVKIQISIVEPHFDASDESDDPFSIE